VDIFQTDADRNDLIISGSIPVVPAILKENWA